QDRRWIRPRAKSQIAWPWRCVPFLPRGDVVAEFERRGDGRDRLDTFADAANRHVTIIQDAAENGLVDVDAFDLVETHLERTPLDEPGLVHHPQIGHVGFGGPDVEPG